MKQEIKNLISLKATSVFFSLLFFVALAGGVVINAPGASATEPAVSSAKITAGNQLTVVFTTAVNAATGDFTDLKGSIGARGVTGVTGSTSTTIVVTFDGAAVGTDATATIDLGAGITSVDTTTALIAVADQVVADGQAPTMDSAETKNTMTIDITFSEDLDMGTIAIADFAVDGSYISGINELAGVVTLTLSSAIATDATPVVTLVSGEAVSDTSGNAVTGDGSATYDKIPTDGIAPTVALTYSANPAKVGAMTVTATYSEAIVGTPNISIDQQGTTDITAQAMSDGATV